MNKMESKYIDDNGYYRFEGSNELVHRRVMEDHLRRHLTREEVVYHCDGDKLNDEIDNLVLMK